MLKSATVGYDKFLRRLDKAGFFIIAISIILLLGVGTLSDALPDQLALPVTLIDNFLAVIAFVLLAIGVHAMLYVYLLSKKCPRCSEKVRRGRYACYHCGHTLSQ